MDIVSTILSTAKMLKVPGMLLLAICSHESLNFTLNYSKNDRGSPSFGYCQIKKGTAELLGFRGNPERLKDPKVNAYWAAKYLEYQQKNYGNDWVMLTAAYNAGTYNPSNKVVGCPRNLRYVKLIKEKLPEELKEKLNCGHKRLSEGGGIN